MRNSATDPPAEVGLDRALQSHTERVSCHRRLFYPTMTRGRRLAFLITGLGHGGAETQLVRLATSLKRRGWEMGIISISSNLAYADELRDIGIDVVSLNVRCKGAGFAALLKSLAQLKQWRPDVLTAFMFHANLLGCVAGRLAGVPAIVSSIRTQVPPRSVRGYLERLATRWSDVTVTNSTVVAETLVRQRGIPAERVHVIPNGISLTGYENNLDAREGLRRELAVGADEFLWLAVGRLEKPKDYPTLLRAFRLLLVRGEHARLIVAGETPLLPTLSRLAATLRVASHVRFLGFRRDVPALLSVADGLVLSSAREGLPNAVMEALAAAKPVVATRVGGVPELVLDGVSGFLVPPRNPEELADAMTRLMRLPRATLERMGEAGRSHVVENYSSERMVESWERLYNDLLARRDRAARQKP